LARPKPLSGFPEFLPAGRIVENRVLDVVRSTFELHGFAPIETRAVEPLDQLARKGEIDKEIYVVRRLHADAGDADELGLHFDLTVPFARYVLENSGHLAFPFRRYQVQRGERPQEGRYREFTQADIDIVGQCALAAHHDVEIPLVALDVFERLHRDLGLPPVSLRVNNRKLSEGFYRGLGIEQPDAVLQRVDKYDKIGPAAVAELLTGELGLSAAQAEACVRLAGIAASDESFVDRVRALGVEHELLDTGLEELSSLIRVARRSVPDRVVVDLKIARGLDYYTGTVYETLLVGSEKLGSVASGGRYDSLASDGKTTFPGVGYSFGITRILAPLIGKGALTASRSVSSAVLVAVDNEEAREQAIDVAARLRARGIAVEVAPKADRFGKQIRFAERRGIPFVWFGAGYDDSVKDIRTGDQSPASPDAWTPPAEDLHPTVAAG
jgi:histidyl-tRNA synthetase